MYTPAAPLVIVAGLGFLAYQGYQGYERYDGFGGAVANVTGVAPLYEGLTNTDWGSGRELNLSHSERGALASAGLVQLAMFSHAGARFAARAPRVFGYEWAIGPEAEGSVLFGANRILRPARRAKADALKAMLVEDAAEFAPHDKTFYSPPNRNSLQTLAAARGYSLKGRATGAILKYGETTQGAKRYSQTYLDEIGADLVFEAAGSKQEMHAWQHEMILKYKATHGGRRPPLNKSDW